MSSWNPTPYTWLPTDTPTRARILFFGSRVMRFVRDLSCHIETPKWNFYNEIIKRRWYRNRLLIMFLEESREEYLKRLCKQTPLWLVVTRKSLRNPEEQADSKKRDVEQSAPTHVRHTHCTSRQLGTTADQKYDVPWDWLRCAKWQGSVEEPAAKDFVASKVCTIELNKVKGTSWNAIKCKERMRSNPAAVVRQETINLIHKFWNPISIPFPSWTALT